MPAQDPERARLPLPSAKLEPLCLLATLCGQAAGHGPVGVVWAIDVAS